MYLLLMSNKASNILEDLETLRLLSKVLPEYVLPPMDEESISQVAFELLFAFDEVISLGYKENVTVGQVKQNTEMESHEEKLHKMIIASKVSDTKVSTTGSHSLSVLNSPIEPFQRSLQSFCNFIAISCSRVLPAWLHFGGRACVCLDRWA